MNTNTRPDYTERGYHYVGDANPLEFGGKWINPQTGHIIEITGKDAELRDKKGRPCMWIDSTEVGFNFGFSDAVERVRKALECCCDLSREDFRSRPREERRIIIMDALHSYGDYDPADEYPNHYRVETHRDVAALRAIDNFVR